jgi:hypothetical protein
LTPRAAEFVTLLSGKDYETAVEMFDETMASVMPQEKLEEVWQTLLSQLGSFETQNAVRKSKIPGYDRVELELRVGPNELLVFISKMM